MGRYARSRRLVSLTVLFSITGLSLFLFSPWHRHNRLSAQPCAFTNLEHGSWSEDLAHPIGIEPPTPTFVISNCLSKIGFTPTTVLRETPVRAPPLHPAV